MSLVSLSCVADLVGVDLCACDSSAAMHIKMATGSACAEASAIADRELEATHMIVERVRLAGSALHLKQSPLIAVHEVKCCERGEMEYCHEGDGVLRIDTLCPCYQGYDDLSPVKVTYSAGYITEDQSVDPSSPFFKCEPTVPEDLKFAICDTALARYVTRCLPSTVTSEKNLSSSVSYSVNTKLGLAARETFERYRRVDISV